MDKSVPGSIGRERAASVTARRLSRALAAAAIALFALGPLDLAGGRPAEAQERGRKVKPAPARACRKQAPQKFLERRSYLRKGMIDPKKQARAVRYLAERYGRVDHESTARWNSQHALAQAKNVRFMGLPLSVHAKIAPALACVEKRILDTCTGKSRYTPRAVGGFRSVNTYRGGEVSNHLFGIAIDIDPDRNPCCGCVDPWPSNPVCKNEGSVYKRTALPKCWINAFERFGFDWLGHDTLEDTMHFEFLGDPARIRK